MEEPTAAGAVVERSPTVAQLTALAARLAAGPPVIDQSIARAAATDAGVEATPVNDVLGIMDSAEGELQWHNFFTLLCAANQGSFQSSLALVVKLVGDESQGMPLAEFKTIFDFLAEVAEEADALATQFGDIEAKAAARKANDAAATFVLAEDVGPVEAAPPAHPGSSMLADPASSDNLLVEFEAKLRELFERMDVSDGVVGDRNNDENADSDGKLDKSELRWRLPAREFSEALDKVGLGWESLDANEDGKIDHTDLIKKLDMDGDNKLSFDEFVTELVKRAKSALDGAAASPSAPALNLTAAADAVKELPASGETAALRDVIATATGASVELMDVVAKVGNFGETADKVFMLALVTANEATTLDETLDKLGSLVSADELVQAKTFLSTLSA